MCAWEVVVSPDLDISVVVMPGFLENYLRRATFFGGQLDHTIDISPNLYISSWEWVSRRQNASSTKAPRQLSPLSRQRIQSSPLSLSEQHCAAHDYRFCSQTMFPRSYFLKPEDGFEVKGLMSVWTGGLDVRNSPPIFRGQVVMQPLHIDHVNPPWSSDC